MSAAIGPNNSLIPVERKEHSPLGKQRQVIQKSFQKEDRRKRSLSKELPEELRKRITLTLTSPSVQSNCTPTSCRPQPPASSTKAPQFKKLSSARSSAS